MAHWPQGVAYLVTTKRDGQQKPQLEGEFIVDVANGYDESQARLDADTLMADLYGAHTGGRKEYLLIRAEEAGFEVRPVEQ